MLRFIILLVIFNKCFCTEAEFPKCCESDSVLEKTNSSYSCIEDLNKRTQIVANRTNFIESLEDDFCIDVENNTVSLFQNNQTELFKIKDLDVDFYPKCCPLNYFYNRTTHACVNSTTELESFFGESFLRVGLPHCEIIEDLQVNTNSFLKILNGSVYLSKNSVYQQGSYCVDKDERNLFIMRICHDDYDICDKIRCVRKCCLDGQSFINGSHCHNTFVHGLDLSAFPGYVDNVHDNFVIIHDGFNPPIYPLLPPSKFHLDEKGMFTMVELTESLERVNVTRSYNVDQRVYCIEHAKKTTLDKYMFFREFPKEQTQIKFVYTGVAMTISCFFLLLTVLYYGFSDEKKNLFGKILISYCTTALVSFVFLTYFAFENTRPDRDSVGCITFAFAIFYLTLSMFTWMNVMCIDIYCTFGSSKSFSSRTHKSRELKRFLLYALHGWGTPLLITVVPLTLYHMDVLPYEVRIMVDAQKCLMYTGSGNYALFSFSTTPLTIIQICDMVLFIKTIMYCLKVKREINRMNDSHAMKGERRRNFNKYRDRIGLLLKLFVVMGISFLFEVVSTFYKFKEHGSTMAIVELVWDTFNSLQGVFIFVIFILKKRIFSKFEKKVGLQKLRKISLVSSAMTQTTSLPALSKQ